MKLDQYPLFRHWYQTLLWMLDRTESFPRKARLSLTHRLEEYGFQVLDLITEAIFSPAKARRAILRKINLLLDKLRILFRLSHDRRYLSTKQYAYVSSRIDETGKMTGGWLKTL